MMITQWRPQTALRPSAEPARQLHTSPPLSGHAELIRAKAIWLCWVLAQVIAEVLVFGLVAWSFAVRDRAPGTTAILTLGLLFLAGLAEGALVGTAQWLVLRRWIPRLSARLWIGVTAWVAGVGYGLGLTLAQVPDSRGPDINEPPVWLMLLAGAGLGAATGLIFGGAQWVVLRRVARQAGWWVPANAVGWALGMVIAFAGASAVPADAPFALILAVGAITGAGMGAVAGAVTGLAVIQLCPR